MSMSKTRFNHVTIYCKDRGELEQFYTEVFDLERVQEPNLGNPIIWLRCGDQQLHIVERDTQPPQYHHFALTVADFDRVFELAVEGEYFDTILAPDHGLPIYELPDGAVQMYLRDPAGNLVEVDHPDIDSIAESIRNHVQKRSDRHKQSDAQAEATLFMNTR